MREVPGFTPGLAPGVPGFDAAAAWNDKFKSISAFRQQGRVSGQITALRVCAGSTLNFGGVIL